jgi:formiminoglutamate deiminase
MYIHNDAIASDKYGSPQDAPKRMEAMVTSVFAKSALLETGWARSVRFELEHGCIRSIQTDAQPHPDDEHHDIMVPGTPNVHSHAFQRAMSGLAETRGPANDSFWSWRTVMYRFALAFRPEQLEAVAAQLYMEMLEAGFTRVGEFHYLHHDQDGQPYANIAEHAERVAAAAAATGIALTLLPVFYAHSGFGGAAPSPQQRRFINSVDGYGRLVAACRSTVESLPGGRVGLAPHSLRAATPEELTEILAFKAGGPVHIHISEQVKEVEECIVRLGARPVEWLLANAPVDHDWTLVHATHVDEREIAGMGRAEAVVGLCPITEANLGDGIFPAPPFLQQGGRFGIGSDSNIAISLTQELRMLEYSQRLDLRSRNIVADAGQSTGARLLAEAVSGGAQSIHGGGALKAGGEASFVSLDTSAVPYLTPEAVLDHWIFGDGVGIDSVWVLGKKRVSQGRHVDRDRISAQYRQTMKDLLHAFA